MRRAVLGLAWWLAAMVFAGWITGPRGALCLAAAQTAAADQEGQVTIISWPREPDKHGRPQPPWEIECWLPAGCDYVRGIVVAHPMIAEVATGTLCRRAATEAGLGTVVFPAFAQEGAETWRRLDALFDQWAKATGHREIRGAAVLVAGLSASVLWARLVAYEKPERVFGIIHAAGGNLHHYYPPGKTLSGVPFIAMNGQFESCGPEGGIRPHLGLETQWYLMGETMLERRRQDANHLMSLVVVPGKGHTAWNHELAALFIRKAAQYRLPQERRDGSKPARCVPLRAEDGWLTDRDVKYPRYPPAPYNEYQGDKLEAFWHFDEQMARAVCRYHQDGVRAGQERSIFRPAGLFEKLWPLGQRMDIPFEGSAPAQLSAALRKWISTKTGMDANSAVVRCLAEGIAAGLRTDDAGRVDEATCRQMCLRICYAFDDFYRPVEQAIDQADLPENSKALLRAHYAALFLVRLPHGQEVPRLPLRAIQAAIGRIPAAAQPSAVAAWLRSDAATDRAVLEELYGKASSRRPDRLDQLLEELKSPNSEAGWAAAEQIARIGAAAIPDLVYVMDFGGQPANFRAAAALGLMGQAARPALTDLQQAALRCGTTEQEGLLSRKALEAIANIENEGAKP